MTPKFVLDDNMLMKRLNAGKPVSNRERQKDFTHFIGENGPWQMAIFVYSFFTHLVTTFNHMSIGFFSKFEKHWCARPESWTSTKDWRPPAISNHTEDVRSQCKVYSDFALKNVEQCYRWEFVANESTVIQEWNLVCDNEWLLSLCQSVYMAGYLISVLFSGQMADIYGRHPLLMANLFIFVLSAVAEGFSTSFVMFTIFRFLIGFGIAGSSLISYIIIVEILGPSKRSTIAFFHGLGSSVGYSILPLIAWYIRDWRKFQFAITLPCILFIPIYWLIPESPRWLLSQGKYVKAAEILKKAAKWNGKSVDDLEKYLKIFEFNTHQATKNHGQATVFDLFRTPNMRKKTLILQFTWMVISFVYYGISLSSTDTLGGNYYLNFFLLGVIEIPGVFFCIASQVFGRKWPFIFMLVISGFSCIGCATTINASNWIVVSFAITGKFFVSSAFGLAYVYSAEIYPTVARNVGVGSCSTMARVGSIIAPFMKELGKITYSFVPMAIFGVLPIICGALSYMLPETHKLRMPETLQDAEDFEMEGYLSVELKPMLSSDSEEHGNVNEHFVSSDSENET